MDPKDLERALSGLDYPAPRNKLITKARENRAPQAVIDRLLTFPETADFHNEAELRDALGVSVPGTQPEGWQ
jgi:hypothetical protein